MEFFAWSLQGMTSEFDSSVIPRILLLLEKATGTFSVAGLRGPIRGTVMSLIPFIQSLEYYAWWNNTRTIYVVWPFFVLCWLAHASVYVTIRTRASQRNTYLLCIRPWVNQQRKAMKKNGNKGKLWKRMENVTIDSGTHGNMCWICEHLMLVPESLDGFTICQVSLSRSKAQTAVPRGSCSSARPSKQMGLESPKKSWGSFSRPQKDTKDAKKIEKMQLIDILDGYYFSIFWGGL